MTSQGRISRADFKRSLTELGLRSGDVVMVHSPPEGLDTTLGDADTIIDAFMEIVGPEGTLCMPALTPVTVKPPFFEPVGHRWVRTSPTISGKISEAMRLRGETKRSGNASHSVIALGKRAEEITNLSRPGRPGSPRPSPWTEWTFSSKSPWEKLYMMDAKSVLLGVGWEENPMFQYVQSLFIEPYFMEFAVAPPFPNFSGAEMGKRLEALNLVETAELGSVTIKCIGTKKLIDSSLRLLGENTIAFFPDEETNEFVKWFRRVPTLRKRLKIGAAKVCINPPSTMGSSEYLEDIHVRALVVEGRDFAAIVCSDVPIDRSLTLEARMAIQEKTGIPSQNVMIGKTHNHHGLPPWREREYQKFLKEKIVEVVAKAFSRRQPARLGFASREIHGKWYGNRRLELDDGSVVTLRSAGLPTWFVFREGKWKEGPLDREIGVLRIEDLQGKLIAVVTSFGCHNIARDPRLGTLGGHLGAARHGGFFGHAMLEIERANLGSVAIILAGAIGNTDMWFPNMANPWVREHTHVRYGRLLAAHVNLAAEEAGERIEDGGSVSVLSRLIKVEERRWGFEPIPSEVQALRIGPMTLVGLPGEMYTDTSLYIKERSEGSNVIIASKANDMLAYLPPAERWAEGGYGVPLSQPWKKDLEKTLKDTAVELIAEIEEYDGNQTQ